MRQEATILQSISAVSELLEGIPFLQIGEVNREVRLGANRIDAVLPITGEEQTFTIILEAKSNGEPRQVRSMIHLLQECLPHVENGYGIVCAPFLSQDSTRICRESGVGFLDLAGNCQIHFDRVFIERKNYPNLHTERKRLRSIFSPKACRVLRVLLDEPERVWMIKDLAPAARVSLGMTFKVKERLLDLEYAKEEGKKVRLIRPLDLLTEWARHYSLKMNQMVDYFGYGNFSDLERRAAEICRGQGIPYALALFSGAEQLQPTIRYSRGFLYLKEGAEIAERLGLKPVSAGANITFLDPPDDAVFHGAREVNGIMVASDIQIYLDLMGFPDGKKAGRTFLEMQITPRMKNAGKEEPQS